MAALDGGTTRVRINNVTSNSNILHNVIPQGSPISAVLFMIAIEEINNIVTRQKYIYISLYKNKKYSYSQHKIFRNIARKYLSAIEKCQLL